MSTDDESSEGKKFRIVIRTNRTTRQTLFEEDDSEETKEEGSETEETIDEQNDTKRGDEIGKEDANGDNDGKCLNDTDDDEYSEHAKLLCEGKELIAKMLADKSMKGRRTKNKKLMLRRGIAVGFGPNMWTQGTARVLNLSSPTQNIQNL